MSGYNQNGGGQGNGAPRAVTLREQGRGDMKVVQMKSGPKSPDMRGYFNLDGRMVSVSLWKEPGKQGPDGRWLPEYYSGTIQWYQGEVGPPRPRQQQNGGRQQNGWGGHQPPQQQGFQYGAPPQQQGYQQHPTYQQPQQPPQAPPPQQGYGNNGYGHNTQGGGYVPTPSAAPQAPPQSNNGGYAQSYGAHGATFTRDEVPF
jgi:hypothetical protein